MKKGLTKNDSVAIKGIAILMMLFHHLYCDVSRFEGYVVSFAPFSQHRIVDISFRFKICVSIFAFITGYGLLKSIAKISLNRRDAVRWNVNRLIKTMSGFWFIYIISFVVTMVINRLPLNIYFKDGSLNGIVYIVIDFLGLANLLGTPTLNATWWYMSAAIIFIQVVMLAYLIAKKVGYLPVVLGAVALPRLLNVGYPGGINLFTFVTPVIFGMLFADCDLFEKISEKAPKNKVLAYIIHFVFFISIIASTFFIPYLNDRLVIWELVYGIIPVVYICFFRYCIVRIPVIKSILQFFGEHSMTIFLSHTFIRGVYLTDFIYSKGHFVVIFVILLVLSTALALVLDTLKRLCKYDKLVSKLTHKLLK